jgi:alpha-amylase
MCVTVRMQAAVRDVEYSRLSDKDGKPPGLMGWWPARAVTFLDNHDTGMHLRRFHAST